MLYENKVDPTIIPVEWQTWLTDKDNSELPNSGNNSYTWQKSRKANLSGTKEAYHPQLLKSKEKDKDKDAIWDPK